MQRRPEFSFPGIPNANPMAPRHGDEEARWLQASPQASPDYSSAGSGTPSPQLWAHAQHHHQLLLRRQYPASAGTSPSRAQAIAGYRREMLDLVRNLPESAYELSLRDIVEHRTSPASPPRAPAPLPPSPPLPIPPSSTGQHEGTAAVAQAEDDHPAGDKQSGSRGKKQGRKQRTMRKQRSRSLERSVSLDTGLLIKFFLPLYIAGKKKVSPKPDAAKDGKKKKKKKQGKSKKEAVPAPTAPEEEWWTKSEFSEAGTSSRTSSSNSNSSAASVRNVNGGSGSGSGSNSNPRAPDRSWSRKRAGCYAFLRANKGKNGVNQD